MIARRRFRIGRSRREAGMRAFVIDEKGED
jgi:hypothetical protein